MERKESLTYLQEVDQAFKENIPNHIPSMTDVNLFEFRSV